MKNVGLQIQECIDYAFKELSLEFNTTYDHSDECNVWYWQQTWGSTAGPFNGIGGCQVTGYPCCVIWFPNISRDIFVFHGGEFFYRVSIYDAENSLRNFHMPKYKSDVK